MKSVLEIITILIFLFCITMLERMDDNCCYYNDNNVERPAETQFKQNGGLAASPGIKVTAAIKPAKYQLPYRAYAKAVPAK